VRLALSTAALLAAVNLLANTDLFVEEIGHTENFALTTERFYTFLDPRNGNHGPILLDRSTSEIFDTDGRNVIKQKGEYSRPLSRLAP
jgi:hypothetical protein